MNMIPETRVRHCQAVREQLERWGIPSKDLADWRGNATLVGLVFSGASGAQIKGLPVADYYDYAVWDPQESLHTGGLHKAVVKLIESHGGTWEWYDPGTITVYFWNAPA